MNVRPLQDRVLVELDEERGESHGGILLVGHDTVRTGTVRRVGPGKQYRDKFLPTTVKPEERIAFLQATIETKSEAQLTMRLPDGFAMIREPDILFAMDGEVRVTK